MVVVEQTRKIVKGKGSERSDGIGSMALINTLALFQVREEATGSVRAELNDDCISF